jgi:hypothetical protein
MHKYLIYDRIYDVYFNYGIYSKSEVKLISLLFEIFRLCGYNNQMIETTEDTKWRKNINSLKELIESYEDLKNKNRDNQESSINKSFYEQVFETYNIGIDIDDLISFLDSELKYEFENLVLYDNDQIIRNCSLIGFILTKSYYNSKLFENHWKRAIETNKEIFILILDDDLNVNDELLKYKCLNISEILIRFSKKDKYQEIEDWIISLNKSKNEHDFLDYFKEKVKLIKLTKPRTKLILN